MVSMRMLSQPLPTVYGGIGVGDPVGTMAGTVVTVGIAGQSDGAGVGDPVGGLGTLHHGAGIGRLTIIGEDTGTQLRYALTARYGLAIP